MDKEIKTFCLSNNEVEINDSLALRFLRVRKEIDTQMKEIFLSCKDEFLGAVSYKASYRYFDIAIDGKNVRFDDALTLESEKLTKCLDGCKGAFIFVATTSLGVDRLIKKHIELRPSKALVIDAIGSSAVECFCDALCQKLQSDYNVSFRPRFSPGYGDLSILCQDKVLNVLDACRRIGVTLSKNNMMIPSKTVSAIVGVRPQGEMCKKASSCELCEDTACPYRE